MARLATVVCLPLLAAALFPAAGCDGKLIRLGTGPHTATVDAACPHRHVNARAVGLLGDSWLVYPQGKDLQRACLVQLARLQQAIGETDEYRSAAAAGAYMNDITNQYVALQGEQSLQVVIMDGATFDTIMGIPVATAAADFRRFLDRVATDKTVEHIVYVLVPELPNANVPELRPLVQDACDKSLVPCHLLDLEPSLRWADHPEYTDPVSKIQPTAAGAQAIADAIWALMQANCIAQ